MTKLTPQDWLNKYYPIPAKECLEADALDNSILKWSGLYPSILKRYGIVRKYDDLFTMIFDECLLRIDDQTCALCKFYFKTSSCIECPLSIARGNVSCDVITTKETYSPYETWSWIGDPKPMLRDLRKAKRAQIKQKGRKR